MSSEHRFKRLRRSSRLSVCGQPIHKRDIHRLDFGAYRDETKKSENGCAKEFGEK
jgi:hypothetical protein